jgi:hypothetical protein
MKAVIHQLVPACAWDGLAIPPCGAAGQKLVTLAAGMPWTKPREAAYGLNSVPETSGRDGGRAIVSLHYEGWLLRRTGLQARLGNIWRHAGRAPHAGLVGRFSSTPSVRALVRHCRGIRTWRHGASVPVTSALGAALRPGAV